MFKKEFWKYFFNTYKNAKWLILRYFIVAVYLTVTSIIANKMNLIDLTYYNAIIGLASFADLIGFGISNGVGIFINQNIKNKDKVSYYVKIGMYLNFIFSLIFVLLLGILFKPMLHKLLDLPTTINYSFYFVMLIYIFLFCILNYFVHTLKELKMFLAEMIVAIIQCILLISGFVLIWLGFSLSLHLISIIYIITTLVAIIFAVIYFKHNKLININLFEFVKIKFIKSEAVVIWRMSAIQIIWQVGYTILGYFILKVSDVFYNQYAYFENILDIFNGLFFSYVTITSVDICRKLGEGDFDESYKIGKYSLQSTFVIWFIYFILSLALSVPIIKGMSIDIQSGAFIAITLYVSMHLFRFLSWNLSSYILCWGGELKTLFWQEVVTTIYFIVFYFVGKFLPQNVYLVYFILTLPTIIITIVDYIIFKRRNWMKKLSENNIKVVVFDFDDTLYSGVDWTPWEIFCRQGLKELFKNLDKSEYNEVLKRFEEDGASDESVVKELILHNRSPNEWLTYRDTHPCEIDYSTCKITNNNVLKEFASKYTLYIASNSTLKDIISTAKKLNLDLSVFKEILVNVYFNSEMSKKVLYNQILEKENIKPDEMFVIGNSMHSDIQPALELGAQGKQIKEADFKITDFDL